MWASTESSRKPIVAMATSVPPAGEQWTMFLLDTAGNALEFKPSPTLPIPLRLKAAF